jgi:hypothetical protein
VLRGFFAASVVAELAVTVTITLQEGLYDIHGSVLTTVDFVLAIVALRKALECVVQVLLSILYQF